MTHNTTAAISKHNTFASNLLQQEIKPGRMLNLLYTWSTNVMGMDPEQDGLEWCTRDL
jgi:hypothetical protein